MEVIFDPGKLFKSIDLRSTINSMGLAIKDQNPRGTCSVFASTFLLEYMVCKSRGLSSQLSPDGSNRTISFSEEYLNSVANIARQQLGGSAIEQNPDGDTFQGCLWGYQSFGIVEEEWFPYQNTFDPNHKPDKALLALGKAARFLKGDIMLAKKPPIHEGDSPRGLDDDQISIILGFLDKQIPVAFGMFLASDIQTVHWGSLSVWDNIPDETNGPAGHSVGIVGYLSGPILPSKGYFIFRNSWGNLWGDKGYGYISFDYARKYVYDVVVYDKSPRFIPGVEVVKPYKIPLKPPTLTVIDKLGKLIHPNSRISF
jgi:hypothetical protein